MKGGITKTGKDKFIPSKRIKSLHRTKYTGLVIIGRDEKGVPIYSRVTTGLSLREFAKEKPDVGGAWLQNKQKQRKNRGTPEVLPHTGTRWYITRHIPLES